MEFQVRFVASDVSPLELDGGDADWLAGQLRARLGEERLGLPDLLGRLEDGPAEGRPVTIDETQADELIAVLRAAEAEGEELPASLRELLAACMQYRS